MDERMQWLKLWDELRDYFASSRENTRWRPSELVNLMDAREKRALRSLVNGEEQRIPVHGLRPLPLRNGDS